MRFIDEALITVSGGHGGPGCVSFRRETFTPRGGPDGGDGGDGGDVIFRASNQLGTLQDFRYRRAYQAPAGMHGSGTNKAGRDGDNIEIKVPVGTVIRDAESGEILVDFTEDGQEWVACQGGRGGKGNAHFVTSTFQAPRFAQEGEEGESRSLKLELKLLADAAIIGFPNAGKSTLISRISAARPKIADYAFTTLSPNLGVVSLPEHRSFVIADIPGLIEGAHRGLGLGHRFLKHIERTRVFVHLLDGLKILEDATGLDTEEKTSFQLAIEQAVERYETIRKELGLFNAELLDKPEILVLNKLDVLSSDPELVARVREALRAKIREIRSNQAAGIRGVTDTEKEPFVISAATGQGLNELLMAIDAEIRAQKAIELRAAEERSQPRPGLKTDVEPRAKIVLPDDDKIRFK